MAEQHTGKLKNYQIKDLVNNREYTNNRARQTSHYKKQEIASTCLTLKR